MVIFDQSKAHVRDHEDIPEINNKREESCRNYVSGKSHAKVIMEIVQSQFLQKLVKLLLLLASLTYFFYPCFVIAAMMHCLSKNTEGSCICSASCGPSDSDVGCANTVKPSTL